MIEFFKEFPVFGYVIIVLVLLMAVVLFFTIRPPRKRLGIDGLMSIMRDNKPLKSPSPKSSSRPQPNRRREDRGFNDSISFLDSE